MLANILKGATAAAKVISLSFVSARTENAASINLPTGSAAGDLVVFVDAAINVAGGSSIPTLVVPPGFTSFISESALRSDSGSGSGGRLVFSWKVLTSSDIAAGSITGMVSTSTNRKCLVSVRPTAAISNVDTSNKHSQATAGTTLTSPITRGVPAQSGKFFIAAIYAQNTSSIRTSPALTNDAPSFGFNLAYGVTSSSITTILSQTGSFRSFGAVHIGVS